MKKQARLFHFNCRNSKKTSKLMMAAFLDCQIHGFKFLLGIFTLDFFPPDLVHPSNTSGLAILISNGPRRP